MLAGLLQLLGIITMGAAAAVFGRAYRERHAPARARAVAVIGAGYLLFGSHVWRVTTAVGVWSHLLLDLAALALVSLGIRALRGPRPRVDPLPGAAPELALVFVGRLTALGPAGWAASVAHARAHPAARAAACAIVGAVVADLRLQGAELYLTRAIAALLRGPGARGMSGATRACALSVGRAAALAVLVRPTLAPQDFEALYAPFAPLVPAPGVRSGDAVARQPGRQPRRP